MSSVSRCDNVKNIGSASWLPRESKVCRVYSQVVFLLAPNPDTNQRSFELFWANQKPSLTPTLNVNDCKLEAAPTHKQYVWPLIYPTSVKVCIWRENTSLHFFRFLISRIRFMWAIRVFTFMSPDLRWPCPDHGGGQMTRHSLMQGLWAPAAWIIRVTVVNVANWDSGYEINIHWLGSHRCEKSLTDASCGIGFLVNNKN